VSGDTLLPGFRIPDGENDHGLASMDQPRNPPTADGVVRIPPHWWTGCGTTRTTFPQLRDQS